MKYFGLLSLLIVVGVASWLIARPVAAPSTIDYATPDTDTSYLGAIDVAKTAADSLSGGGIEIYTGVKIPRASREVDLSGRGYEGSLKAEIRQLTDLEVLDISNNNFTGLPAEVGQLSKLRVLNLSNNPLTGLPYELGNLKNLETLDLRGTNYAPADLEVIKQALPSGVTILID